MQSTRTPRSILAALAVLTLIFGACAAEDPVLEEARPDAEQMSMDDVDEAHDDEEMHEDEEGEEHMEEEGDHAGFAFGEPADAADADRVIEINAVDIAFEPASIDIAIDETITFRVVNSGAIPHDFTLGTAAMQDEHEAEMAEMGGEMMMHEEANAFALAPGESKETTWHFTEPGELFIGCHQTGHYAAGMKIEVTVSG